MYSLRSYVYSNVLYFYWYFIQKGHTKSLQTDIVIHKRYASYSATVEHTFPELKCSGFSVSTMLGFCCRITFDVDFVSRQSTLQIKSSLSANVSLFMMSNNSPVISCAILQCQIVLTSNTMLLRFILSIYISFKLVECPL